MDVTPWKTKDWFVSLWNYQDEVRSELNFPEKIRLHDVTLRDGEQQAGLVFNAQEKVELAERLAQVGVHRIEAGMPAVSPEDEKAVKEIVKRDLAPEIFAFGRCMEDDVKRAVDCGVHGLVVEIPSSEHIIKNAYNWSLDRAIELSVKATSLAKENGLYTVFFPIDASRADIDWCLNLLERVAEDGHMDALCVVDTFGGLAPHAIPHLIKRIKGRISDKPIEVHFHDDFGLGTANTLMALAAGAEVAHTTISAIGERCGNTSYEELVLALKTMYGVDVDLDLSKIYELSQFLQSVAGINVRPNKGILGNDIFNIESGIVVSWFNNCREKEPLELFPYKWDLIGRSGPQVVLGKNSGIDSINIWLEEMGEDSLSEEQKMQLVQMVKEKALEKHGLLNKDDFKELVKKVQ